MCVSVSVGVCECVRMRGCVWMWIRNGEDVCECGCVWSRICVSVDVDECGCE